MSTAIQYFSPQEIARLRRYCAQEATPPALMIELLAVTGMRTDELNNLQAKDFDVNSCRVYIHGSKKSNDGWKKLDHEFMARLAAGLLVHLQPNDLITSLVSAVAGQTNAKMQVRRIWYRVRMRVFGPECRLSVHKLRHSLGMAIQNHYGDILKTQSALRHKAITSTVRYLHMENAEQVDDTANELFNIRKAS